MQWSKEQNAGFSKVKPWIKPNENWIDHNIIASNNTIDTLKTMIVTRQNEVVLI